MTQSHLGPHIGCFVQVLDPGILLFNLFFYPAFLLLSQNAERLYSMAYLLVVSSDLSGTSVDMDELFWLFCRLSCLD